MRHTFHTINPRYLGRCCQSLRTGAADTWGWSTPSGHTKVYGVVVAVVRSGEVPGPLPERKSDPWPMLPKWTVTIEERPAPPAQDYAAEMRRRMNAQPGA